MSDSPETVELVFLVIPGQGYQPINLPKLGLTGILPGRAFTSERSLAGKLLRRFPNQVAVISWRLPAEEKETKE